MSYLTNNDNVYRIGSTVAAKKKPGVPLVVMRYYHRTYYCLDIADPAKRHLEFFEKDLVPVRQRVA